MNIVLHGPSSKSKHVLVYEEARKMAKKGKKPPKMPPQGKRMICRPWVTLKNGKRLYASAYGKEAFCFYVND